MTPQNRLFVVFGGLFGISLMLLGSITLPSSATSGFLSLLVLTFAGVALYYDRQDRPHH